jgi:hypothetical protein
MTQPGAASKRARDDDGSSDAAAAAPPPLPAKDTAATAPSAEDGHGDEVVVAARSLGAVLEGLVRNRDLRKQAAARPRGEVDLLGLPVAPPPAGAQHAPAAARLAPVTRQVFVQRRVVTGAGSSADVALVIDDSDDESGDGL